MNQLKPSIRRDCVKRFLDGMMRENMSLYEQILDDPKGFGYHFNKLVLLALSEFKETKPRKNRRFKRSDLTKQD